MEIVKLSQKVINKASDVIKNGGVVVFPTDTVYGLICDSGNKKAIEKIFKIKKRPKGKPISIFVNNIETAKKFAKINKKNEEFLLNNWPGPTTAVLKIKKNVLSAIHQGKKTIGVRISNYKLINELILNNKAPIAETSANISGGPATIEIKKVLEYFENKKFRPDLIIDAGNLPERRPSKVIDLTNNKIKILRK